MDVLSDVLRVIRFRGALFLHAAFGEPWCVDTPGATQFAPLVCPGARHLAILHMVLQGRCWAQLPGQPAVQLVAGDAVVFPHGDAHLIGTGRGHAPVERAHVVPVRVPHVAPLRYGGDGEETLLVCGWFAYERNVRNPLLAALPAMIRTALGSRPAGEWLQQSVRHALREAGARPPGASAVTADVAEALFVETLRGHVDGLPPRQRGWLAGLRDPVLGRCLAVLHAEPARAWSLDTLAREVHTSRSLLADRFGELLGVPPMQYLKRWRLAIAARMLSDAQGTVGVVAQAVGYESESSFSRAFKGEYGVAPGAWRQAAAAGAPEAMP